MPLPHLPGRISYYEEERPRESARKLLAVESAAEMSIAHDLATVAAQRLPAGATSEDVKVMRKAAGHAASALCAALALKVYSAHLPTSLAEDLPAMVAAVGGKELDGAEELALDDVVVRLGTWLQANPHELHKAKSPKAALTCVASAIGMTVTVIALTDRVEAELVEMMAADGKPVIASLGPAPSCTGSLKVTDEAMSLLLSNKAAALATARRMGASFLCVGKKSLGTVQVRVGSSKGAGKAKSLSSRDRVDVRVKLNQPTDEPAEVEAMKQALSVTMELLQSVECSVGLPQGLDEAQAIGRLGRNVNALAFNLHHEVVLAAGDVLKVDMHMSLPPVQLRVSAGRVIATALPLPCDADSFGALRDEAVRCAAFKRMRSTVRSTMASAINGHLRRTLEKVANAQALAVAEAGADGDSYACGNWECERDWMKHRRDVKRGKDSRCRARAVQHAHETECRVARAGLRRARRQSGGRQASSILRPGRLNARRTPLRWAVAPAMPPRVCSATARATEGMVKEARDDLALLLRCGRS
jgi:hypothetical protein